MDKQKDMCMEYYLAIKNELLIYYGWLLEALYLVKWTRFSIKNYLLNDSIYIMFWKRQNCKNQAFFLKIWLILFWEKGTEEREWNIDVRA